MVVKKVSGLRKLRDKYVSREIIEECSSDLNPMLEVVKIGDRYMLNAANTNYSFGGLHRVFQKVFKKLDISKRDIRETLILGFGCGSVATILQNELGIACRIMAVEKDPEVIRLGEAYFNTGEYNGLELVAADAAVFMNENTKHYDLIVVDVYVDFEVPESCESTNFVEDLERSLKPGGMVVFNKLVYNHKAKKEAKKLISEFEKLDGTTRMIKVKENVVNRIIVYEDQD